MVSSLCGGNQPASSQARVFFWVRVVRDSGTLDDSEAASLVTPHLLDGNLEKVP